VDQVVPAHMPLAVLASGHALLVTLGIATRLVVIKETVQEAVVAKGAAACPAALDDPA